MLLHWLSNLPATWSSEVQEGLVLVHVLCCQDSGCRHLCHQALLCPVVWAQRPHLAAQGPLLSTIVS